MWPYILYFVVGGTLVTAVAYVGKHGDGMTAAFVASLPVLFIINMLLLYQNGGVSAGLSYARGALMYLPMFVGCVLLTMVLLPRLDMPLAVLAGVSVYALPAFVRPFVVRHREMRRQARSSSERFSAPVPSAVTVSPQVTGHAEEQHA
jgi:surface polysaccharide O-acyltransferase-like enzyme